jgi:hypothetical protein
MSALMGNGPDCEQLYLMTEREAAEPEPIVAAPALAFDMFEVMSCRIVPTRVECSDPRMKAAYQDLITEKKVRCVIPPPSSAVFSDPPRALSFRSCHCASPLS